MNRFVCICVQRIEGRIVQTTTKVAEVDELAAARYLVANCPGVKSVFVEVNGAVVSGIRPGIYFHKEARIWVTEDLTSIPSCFAVQSVESLKESSARLTAKQRYQQLISMNHEVLKAVAYNYRRPGSTHPLMSLRDLKQAERSRIIETVLKHELDQGIIRQCPGRKPFLNFGEWRVA